MFDDWLTLIGVTFAALLPGPTVPDNSTVTEYATLVTGLLLTINTKSQEQPGCD